MSSEFDFSIFPDDPRIDLCFVIGEITRLMRLIFDKEMERMELTRSQWQGLVYIVRLGGPTQTELARSLDISRPSTGTLINRLEKSGYVTRKPDERDRRLWRVYPTKLAIDRAKEISRIGKAVADDVFSGFTDQSVLDTSRSLQELRNVFKQKLDDM